MFVFTRSKFPTLCCSFLYFSAKKVSWRLGCFTVIIYVYFLARSEQQRYLGRYYYNVCILPCGCKINENCVVYLAGCRSHAIFPAVECPSEAENKVCSVSPFSLCPFAYHTIRPHTHSEGKKVEEKTYPYHYTHLHSLLSLTLTWSLGFWTGIGMAWQNCVCFSKLSSDS